MDIHAVPSDKNTTQNFLATLQYQLILLIIILRNSSQFPQRAEKFRR